MKTAIVAIVAGVLLVIVQSLHFARTRAILRDTSINSDHLSSSSPLSSVPAYLRSREDLTDVVVCYDVVLQRHNDIRYIPTASQPHTFFVWLLGKKQDDTGGGASSLARDVKNGSVNIVVISGVVSEIRYDHAPRSTPPSLPSETVIVASFKLSRPNEKVVFPFPATYIGTGSDDGLMSENGPVKVSVIAYNAPIKL
jgi:hypothetical protein